MRTALLFLLSLALLPLSALRAHADVLELRDGRLVEGVVVRDGDVYVVHSRFGATEVPVADVKTREERPDLDTQIREHLARLDPDDTANRALLAQWLVKVGREDEGIAMAEAIVEEDPENAVAHEVLGHIRHQGVWRTPDAAKRAEGLEKHGDRWYTPQEWANVQGTEREEALAAERKAWLEAKRREVNTAVRLMLSPDAKLRARGRETLQRLAREHDDPSLVELAGNVDAYVEKLAELRKAEAAAAGSVSGVPLGGAGAVMGEIRATVSRLKRPIETFQTNLGSNLGGGPVKIQLPELEVIRVRTTGIIPVVVH